MGPPIPLVYPCSLTKDGCPISRSFFARCGIPLLFPSGLWIHPTHLAVNIGGIPNLAKNQRDMGHPSLVREPGAPLITAVCLGFYCFDLGVESVTAQQVWQVLGEGRTRHHHVTARFHGLRLQVTLQMREKD